MKYIVSLNGKNYEVEVEKSEAKLISVSDAPVAAPAAPAAPIAAPVAAPAPQPTGKGTPLLAPMPGTLLKYKVNNGATVKEGEAVLILEAMKMENEIMAPSDGTVASVNVQKGSSVNTGDVLFTLD